MKIVRESSLEEYATWYLLRESRKGKAFDIPDDPKQQVEIMWHQHCGKMRKWFNGNTHWYIVLLDIVADLENLIFLESPWTKKEGLVVPDNKNYRLISRIACIAISMNYLERPSAIKHKTYYERLITGSLRLEGDDRIAICSAEQGEKQSNPNGKYYLLDGVGRCLPYMITIFNQKQEYEPIEAFLAEGETG
jgi:hypothetical protein